ncbi:hypothetical protein Xmau_03569 [Xenorhabdus mauleonii]|uniref:Uncharacterized protein n=1 Tax=Xenorhabdus mauleonii TaxID=351675 RepID=A0A1I3X0W4_9GAMM|nr:DUF6453 family protein [Xenorhabdus mauleonii]PHM38182.1 hypothetical protein Xmau_03569 [Xenorhabdus mauleonii]SFK13422.1 hypothetical protein SAMN05421680_13118 [Xenorhabdus mauleonii]
MSGKIGIWVRPGDGGKPYYLDSDRAQMLSLLRTVKTAAQGFYTPETSHHIPEARDFNIVLIPTKTVVVGQQGLQSIIRDLRIENIRMEGEYLKFAYSEDTRDFSPFFDKDANFYIQVCGYPKYTESFGIKLAGMNGVSTIADQNRLGYCVYRGRFSLGSNGQWRVPDAIPNRNQCLVFARTETPGAAIGMTHDKVVVNNDVACDVHVVIFSSGFPLQKPDWGIAIYNASGNLTYSSYYTPFFLGEMIPVRNGQGASPTIARPMVHVNRLAKLIKNTGGNMWRFADSGFKFSGNTISISEAGKMDFEYFQANWFSYKPINYDIYAINFDDYF